MGVELHDEYDFGFIFWEYVKNGEKRKLLSVGDDKKYGFYFEIFDENGLVLCSSTFDFGMTFDTYDQCFRAARKWIRDNQNLVYGET